MQTTLILPERYHGRVVVMNDEGVVVEGHNDVVKQGADVMAALAAGLSTYRISHMYFEYQNTAGSPTADSFADTDTAISRQAVTTPYDLIRAPLIAAPVISSTGAGYAGNHVIFTALSNDSTGLNGLPFNVGAHSKVISLCLIAAPGGSNALQDLLYARFILGAALPVSGSGQVSAVWPTTWN